MSKRERTAIRPLLIALCLSVSLAPWALAQQDESAGKEPLTPGEGAFSETVDVTVVNVDVYVTDRKGERVLGLTKDDFEILEDKRPVAITNFFAVEKGEVTAGARLVEPDPDQQIPGLEAKPTWEIPEDQRLYLVVYVDNFNIRPFNRNRVFRRVRQFLAEHVDEQDRVMLISYDRSLNVRQPFTTDPALVSSALYELETVMANGIQYDSERRDVLRELDEAEYSGYILSRLRQHAEALTNDLTFTLRALKDFTDSLAGIPGRKAILYVSDGLPMIPAQDLFHAAQRKFNDSTFISDSFQYDATRKFSELAAQANANRVSFYTIDAAGLRTYSSLGVQNRGTTTPGMDTYVDSMEITNLQSSLLYLADTTGGQAIINSNDAKPGLDRMAEDFDTYYSLGFAPAHLGDGRFHRIKVRVKDGKGLKVRHRDGYRDKPLQIRLQDATTSTLMYGFDNNPMGIELAFGGERRRDDGHFDVTIQVLLPIRSLTLVPRGEQHVGRLRLFVSAQDSDGGTSPVQEAPIPVEIPSDQFEAAQEGVYRYTLQLMMRQGPQRVAIGIRDEVSAETSFIRRSVVVGESG
jgi:VWFA-related protein